MSGISGFSPITDTTQALDEAVDATTDPTTADGATASAAADAPPAEGQVVRGSSIAPRMAPAFATMDAGLLQQQLEAGGQDTAVAKDEVQQLGDTSSQIADLQKQLDEKKAEEAGLLTQLNDPESQDDLWQNCWLSWDLADVRSSIADLNNQIAEAQGKLDDIVQDMTVFWNPVQTALDSIATDGQMRSDSFESQVSFHEQTRGDSAAERRASDRKADRDRELKHELEDRGMIRPAPPESRFVKDEIRKVADAMRDTAVEHRSSENLKRFLDQARALRNGGL